jgi:hypothetical protein
LIALWSTLVLEASKLPTRRSAPGSLALDRQDRPRALGPKLVAETPS